MKDIKITKNHPIKKRYILGPLGRIFLKMINWDIIGTLPDKKRIIIDPVDEMHGLGTPDDLNNFLSIKNKLI